MIITTARDLELDRRPFRYGRRPGVHVERALRLQPEGLAWPFDIGRDLVATEQLLISDSVDRAISEIDFSAMADQTVYLDTRYIVTALDQNYVVSTLRQHMLASGLVIKDKPEDATYVVEVRSGSLGT